MFATFRRLFSNKYLFLRLGGAVTYDEYYCGGNGGRSCKPEPIKETPNEAPMLAPGLKAPGYSSFSIVQVRIEGD